VSVRLRPLLPVVGSVGAASALVALAVALPGGGVSAFLVRLVELVLAGGAAYLLDDAAAVLTGVTPRSLWRRRAPTLVCGLTVLVTAWVAILLLLRWLGTPLSVRALTGELVVLVAVAVALAAVLVWRGDPSPGSRVAPTVGIAGMSALIAEPLLRATIFLPAEGDGDLSGWLAWSAAGLLAVAVILLASRDPASRWRR
jgi:hypothetical protein